MNKIFEKIGTFFREKQPSPQPASLEEDIRKQRELKYAVNTAKEKETNSISSENKIIEKKAKDSLEPDLKVEENDDQPGDKQPKRERIVPEEPDERENKLTEGSQNKKTCSDGGNKTEDSERQKPAEINVIIENSTQAQAITRSPLDISQGTSDITKGSHSYSTSSPETNAVKAKAIDEKQATLINEVLVRVFEVRFSSTADFRFLSLYDIEGELFNETCGRPLLNVENVKRVVFYLISSPPGRFYKNVGDRFEALSKIYFNLESLEKSPSLILYDASRDTYDILSKEQVKKLKEFVIKFCTILVTNPKRLLVEKNRDFFSAISEILYKILLNSNSDLGPRLLINFENDLKEEEFIKVMKYLFDKVLEAMKRGSFEKHFIIEEALFVFQRIICGSPKSLNYFLESSETFYDVSKHKQAIDFQNQTIFGAVIGGVSIWQSKEEPIIRKNYFEREAGESEPTEKTQELLRKRIDCLLAKLAKTLNMMIASSDENKQRVLFWFHKLINLNEERLKLGSNELKHTNTNGFLLNLGKLLLKLCKPLIGDLNCIMSNYNKVNINHLAHPNFERTEIISKDACLPLELPSGQEKSDSPTEIYFLLVKAIEIISCVYDEYLGSVYLLNLNASSINPRLSTGYCLDVDVQIMDPFTIEYLAKFFSFSAIMYLHHNNIHFSLKNHAFLEHSPAKVATPAFNRLPYNLIRNMADFVSMISLVDFTQIYKNLEEIEIVVQFLIYIMGNTEWVQNIHTRAKTIKVLIGISPGGNSLIHEIGSNSKKVLHFQEKAFSVLAGNKWILKCTIPALFLIFIDLEKTENSMHFSERLQNQSDICQLLFAFIQNEGSYSSEIALYIENNESTFVNFMTSFISAIIFCLDECIKTIGKLKISEQELKTYIQRTSLSPGDELKTRSKTCGHLKYLIKLYSGNLYHLYSTLAKICKCSHPFILKDELRDKTAKALTYTLYQLFGSKIDEEIQVKELEAVKILPEKILSHIIEIFVEFENEPAFLDEILNDARSFSLNLFKKTAEILEYFNFFKQQILSFSNFSDRLCTRNEEKQEIEKILMQGCPKEFLDPLAQKIMKDPVMLPSSKKIVELTVIKTHLLNTGIDPFTRERVTADMLIPQPELKHKIQEYVKEKTSQKTSFANKI